MFTRRTFIYSNLQLLVALASGSSLTACMDQEAANTESVSSKDPLFSYAENMQAISFVGVKCKQLIAESNNFPESDLTLSLENIILDRLSDFDSGVSLEDKIAQLIQDDFAFSRTIEISGWQLSQTECELSALAASISNLSEPAVALSNGPTIGEFVEVIDWGPKKTQQGEPFNEQPDGHSGLWFKALNPPASMVVVFDDVWQPTQIYSDSFTSGIRDDFMQSVLSRPGEYRVQIYDKTQQIFQQVGVFRVTKPRATAAFDEDFDIASCKIHAWGPDHTELGYNFNKQPSGHSAFWVKTNCAYQGSELVLGNQVLETTIHDGLLTAMVTNAEELSRGGHKLMLRFGGSGKAVEVGTFKVD